MAYVIYHTPQTIPMASVSHAAHAHSPHILTIIYGYEPMGWPEYEWDCSIENIGIQYLFWLYMNRCPYTNQICYFDASRYC